jgi:hypothetical protein
MFVVIVDLAITFSILSYLAKKKGLVQLFSAGLEKSRALAAEAHDLASNYIRANYSGNPDDLPAVLEQLLVQLDQRARERGITLERPMLKVVLVQSLRPEDGVPMADLQAALRKVA